MTDENSEFLLALDDYQRIMLSRILAVEGGWFLQYQEEQAKERLASAIDACMDARIKANLADDGK